MRTFYKSILVAGCLSAALVQGQTVQVSNSGTITSIQDAIDLLRNDPNPAPNVIEITDGGVYDEVITIDTPVTIVGVGATKPRITVRSNLAGRDGTAGLVVNLPGSETTGTVVLRNLAVLPSLAETTEITSAINIFNNNAFVFLDDVLVTANDGADLPVNTDGLTNVGENGAHKHFDDDAVVFGETNNGQVGDGVEVLLRDTIITNIRGAGAKTVGVLMVSDDVGTRHLRIEDGCVISYLGQGTSSFLGYGIEATGDVEVDAPNERLIMTGLHYCIHFTGTSPNVRHVRGAVMASNLQSGIYENSAAGVRMTLDDCIFANNPRHNIWMLGAAASPVTIRRCTVLNQTSTSYNTIRIGSSTPAELFLEDSIIGGNGSGNLSNMIYNENSAPIHVVNSAVILSGRYNLYPDGFLDSSHVVGEPLVIDPEFENTENFADPNFFDVTSPYYATAGTGGAPLAGGGNYTGTPIGPITEEVVTVSKSGSPNFNTIGAAIASLTPDPSKRYIVQIQDSSVYDEVIDITVPLTLEGVGAERPILAVQENTALYEIYGSTATNLIEGNAGLLINLPDTLTTGTVELKNLVVIPSMSGNAPFAGIANKANNAYVNIDNVLITANNGNNEPVSADGLTKVAHDAAFRYFDGFGTYLGSITTQHPEGAGLEVRIANSVITHVTEPGTNESDPSIVFKAGFHMVRQWGAPQMPAPVDGTARAAAFRNLIINDGCVFSFNSTGLKPNTNTIIDAPNQRLLLMGNQLDGIALQTWHSVSINGMNSVQNGRNGYSDNGNIGPRPTVRNCIVADNGWYNLYMYNGTNAQSPNTFINVTTANQSTQPSVQPNLMTVQVSGASGGASTYMDNVFVDCILAGHGKTAFSNNVINMGAQVGGTLTLDHTAIVVEGPHRLNDIPILHAPAYTINGAGITGADPMFVNTTDPLASDFYAVANAAYGTLSSGGGPLVGGGRYIPSSVADWSVY